MKDQRGHTEVWGGGEQRRNFSESQRKRQDLQEGDRRTGVGKDPVTFPVPPQGQQHLGLWEGLRLLRNAPHHKGRRAGAGAGDRGAPRVPGAAAHSWALPQGWQGPGQDSHRAGRRDGLLLQGRLCASQGDRMQLLVLRTACTEGFAKEMCSFPRSHVAQILFVLSVEDVTRQFARENIFPCTGRKPPPKAHPVW